MPLVQEAQLPKEMKLHNQVIAAYHRPPLIYDPS
jgi:hypothetical protein